jgi:SNF2 family DNA or RNA helicase
VEVIPRPYQLAGRDFLAGHRHALLADEMRVGKTPQAILAADAVLAKCILVVCPAIAVTHWRREWAKWSPGRDPAAVVTGACAGVKHGVVVSSYDMASRQKEKLAEQRWDLFIVDECHYAKSINAARAHMVYGRTGLGWHADRIWSLSGTPAPKHAGELYPMMKAFGVVKMGYPDFTQRYCWFKDRDTIGGTREDRIPELRALLDKFMLRRTRRQVAPEMPEIDYQVLETKPVGHAWTDSAPDVIGLSDAETLACLEANAESLAGWRTECAMAKVPALVDEIDFSLKNRLIERTVVFGHHILPLDDLVSRLSIRGYNVGLITGRTPQLVRHDILDAFREHELDVVVANIQAAGTAIDLSAASHGYFLEMSWVPAENAQAAARMISMSKLEPVTCDICTWTGSADGIVQRVRTAELKTLGVM